MNSKFVLALMSVQCTFLLLVLNMKCLLNPFRAAGKYIVDCQARVQVPNPLSQQAPNPDSKVRQSLKNPKTQFFGLG